MTDTTQAAGLTGLAHEIWALAQRAPGEGIEDCTARIETALGAALAAQAGEAKASVPAGWKPVPVEPTAAMLRAGAANVSKDFDEIDADDAWQAMLAASPAPATDIDEAALARMTEQGAKAWAGVDAQSLRDGSYAPQPQAAQPVAWMFQHDEMGRCCFCANDGVNTIQSFVEANPRMLYVCALYPAAPALTEEQIARAVRPLYASDEAARMGLADDIATVRAALRSTQGGSDGN